MKIGNIDFTIEATKLTLQEFRRTFAGLLLFVDINDAYKQLHGHFKKEIREAKQDKPLKGIKRSRAKKKG